jgi:hypothetical protein
MALYGSSRDMSLFRRINRELMHNIISQQCAFYQLNLKSTEFNIYGEASSEKYYKGPFLLYTLIEIPDQAQPTDDSGVTFEWGPTFRFLRDDLTSVGYGNTTVDIVPQIGDVIFWENSYYEVNAINETQFFMGKNPDFAISPNPLESKISNFGYNVSIICSTHYIPADKVALSKERT